MNGIVVIAASAGGLDPLRRIITALPVPCSAAIFVVMHIGTHRSSLPGLLSSDTAAPVSFAENDALITPGHIFVAPPDHHMILEGSGIRLSRGPRVHFTRPAADPLFVSAAKAHGKRVMGIILSGWGGDGAAGLHAIVEHGGIGLVQDPEEAASPSMPRSAITAGHIEACRPVDEIAARVRAFCA